MFLFGVVFGVRNLNVFGGMFGCVQCSVFGWCSVVFAVQVRCCVVFAALRVVFCCVLRCSKIVEVGKATTWPNPTACLPTRPIRASTHLTRSPDHHSSAHLTWRPDHPSSRPADSLTVGSIRPPTQVFPKVLIQRGASPNRGDPSSNRCDSSPNRREYPLETL